MKTEKIKRTHSPSEIFIFKQKKKQYEDIKEKIKQGEEISNTDELIYNNFRKKYIKPKQRR